MSKIYNSIYDTYARELNKVSDIIVGIRKELFSCPYEQLKCIFKCFTKEDLVRAVCFMNEQGLMLDEGRKGNWTVKWEGLDYYFFYIDFSEGDRLYYIQTLSNQQKVAEEYFNQFYIKETK